MLQCNEIDELMMDWLYQELEPDRSQAVQAHVGGCARCTAEVGSLRHTRDVFRDMTSEEPPASVSAILLHEAARRAPAAAAARGDEVGFWDRLRAWFQPLFAHPAAAAVATLVLVAGVAGALYVRRGSDMAAPRREVASASPPPAAATAPGGAFDDHTGDLRRAEGGVGHPLAASGSTEQAPAPEPIKDAPADGYAAGLLDEKTQEKADKAIVAERRKPTDLAKGSLAKGSKEANDEDQFSAKAASKPSKKARMEPRGDVANAVSGADPLVAGVESAGGFRGSLDSAASPKAPPPSAGAASTTTATRAGGEADADETFRPYREQKPLSAETRKWLESQQSKLATAVKANRCNEAARIANDILDRSPEFYVERNNAQQKKAQPCQTTIAKEQQRRQIARSKNVGDGSSQAAPRQKAKAAERDAEEAAPAQAD